MLAFKSLIVFGLPLIVVANPLATRNDPPTQCNTGTLTCCNDSHEVGTHDSSGLVSKLLGLLGVEALIGELVGAQCSPITVVGLGSTQCTQETLCCTGNTYNGGLITLGCSPINIFL